MADLDGFVTVTVRVPRQLIDDVLVTALEGGSNYWIENVCGVTEKDGKQYPPYYSERVALGGAITIQDDDNEETVIDATKVAQALIQWLTTYQEHVTLDADDCDNILQYAAFGEQRYA